MQTVGLQFVLRTRLVAVEHYVHTAIGGKEGGSSTRGFVSMCLSAHSEPMEKEFSHKAEAVTINVGTALELLTSSNLSGLLAHTAKTCIKTSVETPVGRWKITCRTSGQRTPLL